MKPEEFIYGEIIKEARQKLPNPSEINTKFYVNAVFVPEPFPSLDFIRLVTFEKTKLDNGELIWEFDSIS